jgi:hypothetical protein
MTFEMFAGRMLRSIERSTVRRLPNREERQNCVPLRFVYTVLKEKTEAPMLTIALTALFAFGLAYAMIRVFHIESTPLIQSRAPLPMIGIQIICGDCGGDEDLPIKTYMNRYGACSRCGGKSYVLASNRREYAMRLMSSRRHPVRTAEGVGARVLPFDSSMWAHAKTDIESGDSSSRVRRVAV